MFGYQPLETATSIRLLVLDSRDSAQDGKDDEASISLKLESHELDDVEGKFCALSYTWGSEHPLHIIKVDEQDYLVRENLLFFLQRWQTSQIEAKLFWIDAICLNQDDQIEKSEQITRMRDIYFCADVIFVELGPASVEEERLVGKICKYSRYLYERKNFDFTRATVENVRQYSASMNDEIRLALENQTTDKLVYKPFLKELVPAAKKDVETSTETPGLRLPAQMIELYDDQFWESVQSIFARPWWHRVWVMQEATAADAEDVIVLLGNEKAPLSAYLDCDMAFSDAETMGVWQGRAQPDTGVEITRRFTQLLQSSLSLDRFSLDTLDSIRGQGATDARDIVYVGLNMANNETNRGLDLDYGMTVLDFYKAVAAHFLQDEKEPLKILSHCGSDIDGLEPGWPTWVPDWRLGPYVNRFDKKGLDDSHKHYSLYNPCPSIGWGLPYSKLPAAQVSELRVHGIIIDTINHLSPPCSTPNVEEAADIIAKWIPVTDGAEPYITGESRLQAFQRTIVADLTMEEYPRRGGVGSLDLDHCEMSREDVFERRYHVYRYSQWRRLAYSVKGYMALVDEEVLEGDSLCALYGGSMLYVLRPHEDKYRYIGECYVHGWMDGRAVDHVERGLAKEKILTIV